MSADSSPIVSPVFTARQWNAGRNQSDFRRSPAARAAASMSSQPAPSSLFDSCPAQEDAECIICSPPFRGGVVQSPLGKIEDSQDALKCGIDVLRANAWLSPLIQSPVNDRFYTGLQLAQMQACPRLDTKSKEEDVAEASVDLEVEVLAAIGSHVDDEEKLEKELEEETCGICKNSGSDDDDLIVIAADSYKSDIMSDSYKFGTPLPCKLASGEGSSSMVEKELHQDRLKMDSKKMSQHDRDVGSFSLPDSGTEESRRDMHWKMASKWGFAGFQCNCSLARQRGASSCIERFGKEQYRRWHNETYFNVMEEKATPKQEAGKSSLKDRVTSSIFTRMWNLKVPATDSFGGQDRYGRKYVIPRWMLDGYEVCHEAWKLVVGGSEKKHRTLYALVCGGHGPSDLEARKLTKKLVERLEARTDASGRRDNERRGFAANWWKNYLLLCDFLPNEERIQIRGPKDTQLHKNFYKPVAMQAGLYLSKSCWKECAKEGLRLVAALLPGANPEKLKASRAARHSKFPECQKCQDKRKAWVDACQDLSSDKEWVQHLFDEIVKHQNEWSGDRAAALALRRAAFGPHASAIYECDDKCGSWWQAMPVDPTGREGKKTAPYQFHFSVQANVVCGQDGVLRFAVVPKFVSTGGNFGLTNLLMALYHAKERGRLQPHVKTMYRHTVRGPKNHTRCSSSHAPTDIHMTGWWA